MRPLPLVFLFPYPVGAFLGSVALWRKLRRHRARYDQRVGSARSRSVS